MNRLNRSALTALLFAALSGCGIEHTAHSAQTDSAVSSAGSHADMAEVCANVPDDDDALYFVTVKEKSGAVRKSVLPLYNRGDLHCGVIHDLPIAQIQSVELRCQHISCVNVTRFLVRPRFSETGQRDYLASAQLTRTSDTSVSLNFVTHKRRPEIIEDDYEDLDVEEYDSVPYDGDQPNIRVGLIPLRGTLRFVSAYTYVARGSGGQRIGIPKKRPVSLSCGGTRCKLSIGGAKYTSTGLWRLTPKSRRAHFRILNIKRMVRKKFEKRIGKSRDYRGALEVRITRKGRWVINELPLESYMLGLGEMPESYHYQAHKAQQVAARTYAYYMLKSGSRLASKRNRKRAFHLRASAHDQVYLGLKQEKKAKKSAKAARATAGELVTYRGRVVPTFYFAHSDGWTKHAHKVWGGKRKPWLRAVRAEYDDGKTEFGHGVGMSQDDVSARARAEGLSYRELLAYYYRGTEVSKVY